MTRRCSVSDCVSAARAGRRICDMHRTRQIRHGDHHFHTWRTADDYDVEAIIRDARPAPGLTRLERVKVAQGLTDHGLPAAEIARILTVTPRTVYRWRAEGFRQAA